MNIEAMSLELEREFIKRNDSLPLFSNKPMKGFVFNEGYHENRIHIKKAYGCYVEDCQGNRYIDTALGAGTHLLGHVHPVIFDAIQEQIRYGSLFISPNPYVYDLVDRLTNILPAMEAFVFCNSGTEATMRAVRIARAYTGKKKIGVFGGSWHGGHDLMLVEDDYGSDEVQPNAKVKSAGVPSELLDFSVMLPYNHEAAFRIIQQYKDELAMVIVEPAQGSNPRDDIRAFIEKLRQVTHDNRILLCFDELITGFRMSLGGGQEYWGVAPDIATYGKILGGGLPVGMIAGKKNIMDVIKGTGNASPVFMGGTFSANPLVIYVGLKLISYLTENKKTIYGDLNRRGERVRSQVNRMYEESDIPLRMIGVGSFMRLLFTDQFVRSRRERDRLELPYQFQKTFFAYMLLRKGIHINSSGVIFLSTAHDDEIVELIIKGFCETGMFFRESLKIRA